MIVLMQTDLPEPVVLRSNRWGLGWRSATIASPEVSLPSQTLSGLAACGRSSKTSPSVTSVRRRVRDLDARRACLPGIGARMRISVVASAYERSSFSAATFATFVPGASCSS